MEKIDSQELKRQLMVKYATVFSDLKNKEKESDESEIVLLNYCLMELVLKSNDLESLFDSYLFASENQAMGLNENKIGDAKNGIGNHQMFDEHIELVYRSMKNYLTDQMKLVLSNSTENVQKDFFGKFSSKINDLKTQLAYQEQYMIKYKTYEYESEYRKSHENLGYSKTEASLQYIYMLNYEGRKLVQLNGQVESLNELLSKLGKNNTNEQEISNKHI